jgi:tetratricopeptide (TPR) repeat protein
VLEIDAMSEEVNGDCLFDIGCALYYRAIAVLQSQGEGSGLFSSADIVNTTSDNLFLQAKEIFTQGLQVDPLHGGCWNGLGLTLFNGKGPNTAAAAQACFVRATQIDATAPAFANLGALLMRSNRDSLAKECFSALQLIESNPVIWASLGCIFERSSDCYEGNPDMLAANDSFIAAIEVAKPGEALIGAALTWLKNHRYLMQANCGVSLKTTSNSRYI